MSLDLRVKQRGEVLGDGVPNLNMNDNNDNNENDNKSLNKNKIEASNNEGKCWVMECPI